MVLWTPEHAKTLLPATVIMILLAIGLRFLLKNKSEAIRMIPIQIIAVVLFALEVGKQIYSVRHGYDLYHLPSLKLNFLGGAFGYASGASNLQSGAFYGSRRCK